MNEVTDVLTLPKELFFKEESRRIREAFANKSEYLRHQLQCMKTLIGHLELPWDRYISILFRSFSLNMRHPDPLVNNAKNFQLLALLMDCMVYMSQNGRMINTMVLFFTSQIDDLDKLIAAKELASVQQTE